jgi:hypothetical protein
MTRTNKRSGHAGRQTLLVVAVASLACDQRASRPTGALDEARRPLAAGLDPVADGEAPAVGQRWVLRDSDGDPVNAVVEPTCRGGGANCVIPEIGTLGGIAPQCVRLFWLGEQYVNMNYLLATGSARDCSGGTSPGLISAAYLDDECAGQPYNDMYEGIQDAYHFTRRVRYWDDAGALYYAGAEDVIPAQPYYYWDNSGEECLLYALDNSAHLRAWFPVPDWAVEALPEPPYSITWE